MEILVDLEVSVNGLLLLSTGDFLHCVEPEGFTTFGSLCNKKVGCYNSRIWLVSHWFFCMKRYHEILRIASTLVDNNRIFCVHNVDISYIEESFFFPWLLNFY